MTYIQDSRPSFVMTPAGVDELLLLSLKGGEAVSELFELEVELLSTEASIDPAKIVGQPLGIGVELAREGVRYFHGIVSSFAQTGATGRFVHCRAKIVPWLWLLTQNRDCRIFQNKTVPEILTDLFAELGFADFEMRLQDSYSTRPYCVQYRETTYDFLARLLEEEGIHFFFRHEIDRHLLVIADASPLAEELALQPTIRYAKSNPHASGGDEIQEWHWERSLHSGRVAMTDHDFETPSLDLGVDRPCAEPQEPTERLESFDWHPGVYRTVEEGDRQARLRLELLESTATTVRGRSTSRALQSGARFELQGHFDPALDGHSFFVLSIEHDLKQTAPFETGTDLAVIEYENRFECLPIETPFRPARQRSKPRIPGAQTALVVGPEGEEIHVDAHGRIKAMFHWDRRSPRNEDSSCWIRVAQSAAGKGWGAVQHPRIGQEVVVEFLEGDPDRPLVIGSVYNGECRPPYALPDNKTVSGLKTDSTPDAEGFNELRFDDRAGAEQIFVHAQRDLDLVVENDVHERVLRHKHLIVEGDHIDEVKKNRHAKVERSSFESVGVDRNLTVAGKEAKKVSGTMSLIVDGGAIESISGDRTLTTGGTHKIEGTSIELEAKGILVLKCGGASITLTAGSILIDAPMVSVKGGVIQHDGPTLATGVVQAPIIDAAMIKTGLLSAASVTATSYSPGAGNVM